MEVDFKNGRAIFSPFTEETDKPVINPKESMRMHNIVIGFFLNLIGKAEKRHDAQGKVFFATIKAPKAGIRTHNVVAGFFLSFVGKAEKLHDDKHHKNFYVNTSSARHWLDRHGIKDINPSQFDDPVMFKSPWPRVGGALDTAISIEKLSKKIQENPADIKATLKRGHLFAIYGNGKKAIEDFSKVIDVSSNDFDKAKALQARAECYEKQGSFELAITDYSAWHNIDPKILEFDFQPPINYRAEVYKKMGKWDLALQDYNLILKENPNDHPASLGLYYLLQRAEIHHKLSNLDAAIEDYSNILKAKPDDVRLLKERGKVYLEKKMYKEAIFDLDAVQKRYPKDTEVKALIRQAAQLLVENIKARRHEEKRT